MKINPTRYSPERKSDGTAFKGMPSKPLVLPESLGRLAKITGSYVNTPEQKLFLATTALMFTPLIDLKLARDDQKTDAAIKSASKAMAGGLTGVAIRAGFNYMFSQKVGFTKLKSEAEKKCFKLNPYFFPEDLHLLAMQKPSLAEYRLNQYCKTMGTLFAIAFMILYSNKNVDVPLTSDFQDLLSGVIKEKKTWTKSIHDVTSARADKISAKIDKIKNQILGIKSKIAKINKIITGQNSEEQKNDRNGIT